MSETILSVTQLNEYVRGVLSLDPLLGRMSIRGEISGFKRHTSGHLYFTLKDEDASVRCVMFRQYAQTLAFRPAEGVRVVLSGSASLYVRDGSYQFYVERMRADGEGALYQAFIALRDALSAEGLFNEANKKPLPALPRCVGIVTSETGAVLQDIVRVARRRNPGIRLLLSPAAVQGEDAPRAIAEALARLDAARLCDVIIVGRGGGSMEDLWAFNAEIVARTIAACATPVVSAVGHEVDITIADFAADVRAPTPSAAAEMCVPEFETLLFRVDELRMRLAGSTRGWMERLRWRRDGIAARLAACHPGNRIEQFAQARQSLGRSLDAAMRRTVDMRANRLALSRARLSAMSPYNVLARGYAMIEGKDGLVTRAGMIGVGDVLTITMADGQAVARAEEVFQRRDVPCSAPAQKTVTRTEEVHPKRRKAATGKRGSGRKDDEL